MGLAFGLEKATTVFPRKNRWLFKIKDISAYGINALPPSKGARPSISFKEMEAQHLTETVYFPGKPEWKPINLTLYDIKRKCKEEHPIFEWLKKIYNPETGKWTSPCPANETTSFKKSSATLELYDGCGEILEIWTFEGVWPNNIEFGDLDMQSSDVLTCDLTLRYDRAYISKL